MINHQKKQPTVLILLVSLAIVANAQRPLNTTNTSGFLTEPFFVKPTSTSSRNAIPEMRAAGGGSKPERPPYQPDSYYSHGYIQEHPNGQAQPPRQHLQIQNKLHKVDRERMKKLELQSVQNSNSKKGSFNIFRNIAHDPTHELNQRSENFSVGVIKRTNEPNAPNSHVSDRNLSVSHAESFGLHISLPKTPFNDLKSTLSNKSYLHTPSPPPYSEDYDFDEKLGVKCSFEKPCAWTYDLNVEGGNFEVTTGANLTHANITGKLFLSTKNLYLC
jgi:hypothetical protein